jgi:hypothetical protein
MLCPCCWRSIRRIQFTPEGFERALDWHVRPVVGRLAGKSGILAWDLFNEPDICSPIDQRCWDWDNSDFPLCLQLAEARIAFLTRLHYESEGDRSGADDHHWHGLRQELLPSGRGAIATGRVGGFLLLSLLR